MVFSMKRFLAFTFALLLIALPVSMSYAAFTNPLVSRLATAAAAAGSAGGYTLPARVLGKTSTGSNVASWISLAIPGSNVAKITVAAASIAGALAADYLMAKGAAWWAAHNITHNGDGTYDQNVSTLIPDGASAADFDSGGGVSGAVGLNSPAYLCGIYADMNAAYNAAAAMLATFPDGHRGSVSAGQTYLGASSFKALYTNPGAYYYFFYRTATSGAHFEDVAKTLSSGELESLLALDLAADNSNAKILGLAGLEVAAAALDNPNHPVNMNAEIKAAIAAALAGSINQNQLDNLEAAATPNVGDQVLPDTEPNVNALTPAQIADAVRAALSGQGLSAAQIAAAIAAAQQAAAGGMTVAQAQAAVEAALSAAGVNSAGIQSAVSAALSAAGLATNAGVATAVSDAIDNVLPPLAPYVPPAALAPWVAPAVGDFSGLLSGFLDDMKQTPLFSLPGLLSSSVPSGGECEYQINLGERFGGAKSISICNWATGLSGIKAALLCVCSILAVGIVTKGGG